MTVICPNLWYNEVCYKGTALYLAIYVQNSRAYFQNICQSKGLLWVPKLFVSIISKGINLSIYKTSFQLLFQQGPNHL